MRSFEGFLADISQNSGELVFWTSIGSIFASGVVGKIVESIRHVEYSNTEPLMGIGAVMIVMALALSGTPKFQR